jgi:hypothetical protein
MAGAGGFEPPHDGIKNRCLTAWRRPNDHKKYIISSFYFICKYFLSKYQVKITLFSRDSERF